jgi:superfamily I DNA/RNA helicase
MDRASQLSRYDAILVDEGQDLSEEQIIALTELIAREGTWAFFADWNQDLYGAGKGSPIGADVVFHLHHNCRNTVKINDASNQYLNKKIESMPGMPVGVSPFIESTGAQSVRVWELAKQWSGEGSVAVLSPFRLENSAMKDQRTGHGLRLSTDIRDLGKAGTVFFSTIKSFKGIEAAAVIVVDVGIPGDHVGFSDDDLYVACTRATTRLALLSSRKDVASHFKL